jgi:hypothetical protein
MGDPVGGAGTGGSSAADAPASGTAAPPSPAGVDQRRTASRIRRWIGPVAGIVGIALLIVGGLGFLSASSDHSSRDRADSQRHALLTAQLRADAARTRIQNASDALAKQLDTEVSAGNDLTGAGNAIVDTFDAAVDRANNGDTGGAQAAFQGQAGTVAALAPKVTAERQALGQVQARLRELQAAEQGR